jgi:hypothetical protein
MPNETVMQGEHHAFVRWSPEYDSGARDLTAPVADYRAAFASAGRPPPRP